VEHCSFTQAASWAVSSCLSDRLLQNRLLVSGKMTLQPSYILWALSKYPFFQPVAPAFLDKPVSPTLCTVVSKKTKRSCFGGFFSLVFEIQGTAWFSWSGLHAETRGCMHRQVFIKKTWLSAFSYAQSHISLVFCRSLGFLVPWSSSLTAVSDMTDFLCHVWRRMWVDFICLVAKTISH
jgi:hypothetical protein